MDMDVFDRDAVIQKEMDGDMRKENIIFFKVAEETSGDKDCPMAADVVTFKSMLSTLDIVLTGPIRPNRLGKYDPFKSDRKRPIKITHESNDQVNRAIRNLKPLTDFKLVNVSNSVCEVEAVFFTETWLADDVDNGEFMDPAFVVYRSDRRFVLVRRSVGGETLRSSAICKCKMFFLSVYTVNLYIPPNVGFDDSETFIEALEIFLLDKQYILVGDFNAPEFNVPDLDERRTSSILLLIITGASSYEPGCGVHGCP
ncbi:hypothetical protein Trydic_g23680 [Trypoxylus dichotomus]